MVGSGETVSGSVMAGQVRYDDRCWRNIGSSGNSWCDSACRIQE